MMYGTVIHLLDFFSRCRYTYLNSAHLHAGELPHLTRGEVRDMRYQIRKIMVTVNGYAACKPYLERGFVIDTISYWVSGTTATYTLKKVR